jgi:hypothetical protein
MGERRGGLNERKIGKEVEVCFWRTSSDIRKHPGLWRGNRALPLLASALAAY